MKLNQFEFLMMNNPIRAAFQRHLEAQKLLRMGGTVDSGKVLEIGCGRGVGIQLIIELFHAAHVDAFDLDPQMVALAQKRTQHLGEKVNLWVGDAAAIPVDDTSYDAVFDFGIIHHVPDWRKAISEVYRVLKPNGRFFAEEVSHRFINRFPWRQILYHPKDNRFSGEQFNQALSEQGFHIVSTSHFFNFFNWTVADKISAESS